MASSRLSAISDDIPERCLKALPATDADYALLPLSCIGRHLPHGICPFPLHLLYQMYIVTIGLIKMAEFLVVEEILLFSVCNTKKKYKTTFFPQKSITFAYVVGHKPGHTASIYRL